MRILYLIPARGGSKGIIDKNIKNLAGKPLIQYSIDAVRPLINNLSEICISSDSHKIIKCVQNLGINVPFVRPRRYSTDFASSESVILHALDWYKNINKNFNTVVLLQPTSPLRNTNDIKNAIKLYNESIDLVVSVKKSKANPYFNLFEENEIGFLKKSKESNFTRRQDCPSIYEVNGAIYVINVESLYKKGYLNFNKIIKYEMSDKSSIDIDTLDDFKTAEYSINLKINDFKKNI